jgi:hypothetical protein
MFANSEQKDPQFSWSLCFDSYIIS